MIGHDLPESAEEGEKIFREFAEVVLYSGSCMISELTVNNIIQTFKNDT